MKRSDKQRGAAVVEFAIISSLLAVFVFGIIEFGFLWLQSHYIGTAAREGARIAVKEANESGRTAAAQNAVQEVLGDFYNNVGDCCSAGQFIEVAVDEDASIVAGANTIPGVRVTVTVQSNEYWDPILWDLLALLQGDGSDEIDSITQSAIFAIE